MLRTSAFSWFCKTSACCLHNLRLSESESESHCDWRSVSLSYSLRTDPHRKHRFPHCWGPFTERSHSNGRGVDLQKTSHVIRSQRLHWWAGCCLATSGKHSFTETRFYCCVRFEISVAQKFLHRVNKPQYIMLHWYRPKDGSVSWETVFPVFF
jgi:hypothetical protein